MVISKKKKKKGLHLESIFYFPRQLPNSPPLISTTALTMTYSFIFFIKRLMNPQNHSVVPRLGTTDNSPLENTKFPPVENHWSSDTTKIFKIIILFDSDDGIY